jgi:hypothetical protein
MKKSPIASKRLLWDLWGHYGRDTHSSRWEEDWRALGDWLEGEAHEALRLEVNTATPEQRLP